jgi:hypothetical protein
VPANRARCGADHSQCTFVDGDGRRCASSAATLASNAFALGGPPTLENLCLLCRAHNLESAREVFGEPHIEAKIRARTEAACASRTETPQPAKQPLEAPVTVPAAAQPREAPVTVLSSLSSLGFRRSEASAAVGQALGSEPELDVEQLLRKCLLLLVPKAS